MVVVVVVRSTVAQVSQRLHWRFIRATSALPCTTIRHLFPQAPAVTMAEVGDRSNTASLTATRLGWRRRRHRWRGEPALPRRRRGRR